MIKKLTLTIVLCFMTLIIFSQVKKIVEYKIDAQTFKIDKLGNYYFYADNIIDKYDSNLENKISFQDQTYGAITSIDVSDPMRILVFYENFNSVILLDNYLVNIGTSILLDDLELYSIKAVATSPLSGFLVFDSQNSQILRIDNNLRSSNMGNKLYSVINNSEATHLLALNFILLQCDDGKLLVLDKFGNFNTSYHIEKNSQISFDNDNIYYFKNNILNCINIATKQHNVKTIPEMEIIDFEVIGTKLYILTRDKLIIFEIL